MSRPALMWMTPLLMAACSQDVRPFSRTYSADGARQLVGDIERGSVSYDGSGDLALTVAGESIGRGSSSNGACKRRKGNRWSVSYREGVLRLEATSEYRRADVDFSVVGPELMNTDIIIDRGDVLLERVEGRHVVTASAITTRGVVGDVDLLARHGGFDVEVVPYEDGYVYVDSSSGSSSLFLPYGGNYDVQVFFDPEYAANFDDLGWGDSWLEPGYFAAYTGTGAITVVAHVEDGTFELRELF